jgi:hypothetical protein
MFTIENALPAEMPALNRQRSPEAEQLLVSRGRFRIPAPIRSAGCSSPAFRQIDDLHLPGEARYRSPPSSDTMYRRRSTTRLE